MKITYKKVFRITILTIFSLFNSIVFSQIKEVFNWPEGKVIAISLTWDDGRNSQVNTGSKILDAYDIKATFYVIPSAIKNKLTAWKSVVRNGHEIGNHSLLHPCSGNFSWSRDTALEDYSLTQMSDELNLANEKIHELLGVFPSEFAYPCGQTFVGRGENTKSYVPIISRQFSSGRTWLDESANDPIFCDLAQITGVEMDGKSFSEIKILIEKAQKNGLWLVLAGHEIGSKNDQTTEVKMLKKLLPYLTDPTNKIWVAPVGEIAAYIRSKRGL